MPEKIYTAPYTCVSCGGPKTRTEDDLCPACIEKTKQSAEIKIFDRDEEMTAEQKRTRRTSGLLVVDGYTGQPDK